jgi:hypothetical protein
MKLIFGVESDLYVAGRTEDGSDFTAELYFVTAEDEHGNRWRHSSTFAGCQVMHDDEGYPHFVDVRASAETQALRLQLECERSSVDVTSWYELRPVYGSSAYLVYGQVNDWAEEQTERGFL